MIKRLLLVVAVFSFLVPAWSQSLTFTSVTSSNAAVITRVPSSKDILVTDRILGTYRYAYQFTNKSGFSYLTCEKVQMAVSLPPKMDAIIFVSTSTGQMEIFKFSGSNSAGSLPQTPQTKEKCWYCAGFNRCAACGGLGHAPNFYGGETIPCIDCGGSGRCSHCHGTGYQN